MEINNLPKDSKNKQITFMRSLSFAIQFGFMIVLPLAVFASLGKWMSNRHHNQLWLYLSLVLALITSSIWFYQRISSLYKDFIE